MRDTPTYRSDKACNTSYVPAIVDTVAAVAAWTFTIVKISGYGKNEQCIGSDCSDSKLPELVVMGAVAGVTTGSAIYGWKSATSCRRSPAHDTLPERPEPLVLPKRDGALPLDTPLVEKIPASDPEASAKTHTAHREALIGNCTNTRTLAVEVKELDANYYVQVFLMDEAIVRCLRATPGPAIP